MANRKTAEQQNEERRAQKRNQKNRSGGKFREDVSLDLQTLIKDKAARESREQRREEALEAQLQEALGLADGADGRGGVVVRLFEDVQMPPFGLKYVNRSGTVGPRLYRDLYHALSGDASYFLLQNRAKTELMFFRHRPRDKRL